VYYTTYIKNVEKYAKVDAESATLFSDKYPVDGS
jgi:hypothetical protein